MNRSPLVVGLAAVFLGLTTVLVVVAAVTGSPLTLVVAVPLGLTAAVMWYHASGRLAARTRRRTHHAGRTAGTRVDGGPRAGSQGRVRGPGGPRRGNETGHTGASAGPAATGEDLDPGWYVDADGRRWYVDPDGNRWRGGPGGGTADRSGGPGRDRRQPPETEDVSRRDAYERLGLDPGADEAAVRRAYRELVKEHHPDAEGGDEERFKRVTEAYERLVE